MQVGAASNPFSNLSGLKASSDVSHTPRTDKNNLKDSINANDFPEIMTTDTTDMFSTYLDMRALAQGVAGPPEPPGARYEDRIKGIANLEVNRTVDGREFASESLLHLHQSTSDGMAPTFSTTPITPQPLRDAGHDFAWATGEIMPRRSSISTTPPAIPFESNSLQAENSLLPFDSKFGCICLQHMWKYL